MTSKDFEWFLKEDIRKYKEGDYVIVVNKKVVARARDNLKSALKKVRKEYAGKTPLVVKIPSKETLIL